MRTTTGRQLVNVQQAPKGSTKRAAIQPGGQSIDVDLGGGVVSEGGRVSNLTKPSSTFSKNSSGSCLNPTFPNTHQAPSSIAFVTPFGARLRRGTELAKGSKPLSNAPSRSSRSGYRDFDATVEGFIEAGDVPVATMPWASTERENHHRRKIAQRLLKNGRSVIAAAGDTSGGGHSTT